MKKVLMVFGVLFLLLILVGGGAAAFFVLKPGSLKRVVGGETRLLDYLGAQVVGVANTHLVPDLSFETIRYDPPYTITLGGVRLTAADGTDVLDLGKMVVVLGETPKVGRPIRVARLELSNGAVNLIRDASTGGLRGLSPLVEPTERVRSETAAKPEFRLDSVLVLQKIAISGIDLVYDAGDGSAPMRLDALAADLDIVPATDAGSGWYELDLTSGRAPGLRLDVDGRINIETFDLALNRVVAEAALDEATATTLPPQLAALIGRYQLRGAVRATVTGRVPLLSPSSAELDLEASLDRGRGVFGEYQIPLDSVGVRAGMSSGVVDLRDLTMSTLGGRMTASGRIVLGGDARVEWMASDMRLRELLAARPTDQPPKMAGIVSTTGTVRFPMTDPRAGLSGSGQIDVREGRLVNIPVISDLVRVMEVTGLTGGATFRDSFSSPMTLSPEGVTLNNFEFRTPALHARGSGTLGFSGSLDFSVNGGPVEAIQNKLGKVGDLLGKLTDQVLKYRIRGSLRAPKVTVQPLGIGG
ncbi:MAG: hypothetical protein D6692_09985 [Planctomycetota bacterium]|nr:MAG: hypothetical protein D6692_09985 [Planctomycetota bacterium]